MRIVLHSQGLFLFRDENTLQNSHSLVPIMSKPRIMSKRDGREGKGAQTGACSTYDQQMSSRVALINLRRQQTGFEKDSVAAWRLDEMGLKRAADYVMAASKLLGPSQVWGICH